MGEPEAVFLEPEIVSKKGKIPSREVNETNFKVTRPKSSIVTEKPKAERKQKGRHDEQDHDGEYMLQRKSGLYKWRQNCI